MPQLAGRNTTIDLLRSIALLCVVLAHVFPPAVLFQLRNFDVPMMVFLSGVVFSPTQVLPLGWSNYWRYIWKRIKRLVFPTWIFVVGMGILLYCVRAEFPTWQWVWQCFIFKTGWYTWIIRVFLLVALVAPLIAALVERLSLTWLGVIAAIVLLVFEWIHPSKNEDNWSYILLLTIPYLTFFGLGYVIRSISIKWQWMIAAIALVVYGIYAWMYYRTTGSYQTTNIAKYPPLLYYTMYALAAIMLLWLTRRSIARFCERLHLMPLLTYIGSHTLWIYLWHILWLHLVPVTWHWLLQYACLLVLAVTCTWVQTQLLHRLLLHVTNPRTQTNLKVLFEG